ncbi:deoxyhypusine synthase [Methanosphaera sp. WGK6]|uniref:deoxyhypusine synthase n=1 Tax=Methanosphaera sp. WGK6 TaxID=1561964 RepID=UPI00084C20A2|nr:deoxyhypusine synthase [Methanosphaera sp. WGK6]OED30060.1 deoxyhypusine synthase [Methanosphaera sp. WGK6]
MKVKHLEITKNMSISEFMNQLDESGVLGAGRIAHATNLLADSMKDEDTKIFLSLAGPMIPGGLRKVVRDLINQGHVDLIISSGANLTHDLVEAFGGRHYSDIHENDETLQDSGIGRIADIYTKADDFEVFEEEIHKIFAKINEKYDVISIQKFIYEIGLLIDDENSFIRTAAKKNVPIFAPGLIDCMIGLQLWIYSQDHDFTLSAAGDMHYLSDFVYNSKKVTACMLGGGLPKHYTLASNILTGGIDAGIQITLDRSEGGSLSGAPLEEAKSWAKAKKGSNLVTVVGDATVLFPLIVAGALDKIE